MEEIFEEDLSKNKLNINEILDEVKRHPDIAPLIKGGQCAEYSAHLIPEGGYKKIPKLSANGVILAGDAAGFVNGVHFEGTNFALISGKLAGESALAALENDDYSANTLSIYTKKLENSFILKDLYSYRNIINLLHKRSNSLSIFYPEKMKSLIMDNKINFNEWIKIIKITLPNENKGKYEHKNYLGALIKLGIKREKIGDIVVDENGADIIVLKDIFEFLLLNLKDLTRFQKSEIEEIDFDNLRKSNIEKQIIKITVKK